MVKRYSTKQDFTHEYMMSDDPDGRYVDFVVYEAVLARLIRVETERDQFALEAKYNARDAARYHFIRSKWQFSDAEVDRRVDEDMRKEELEDEARQWGEDVGSRT